LRANPDAQIEVGTETLPVRARVAEDGERERIWERQKQEFPNFAEYEKTAGGRMIPVVLLARAT
jgi:deazaflavin-dependent oxidoreductase (nitroreductase family)